MVFKLMKVSDYLCCKTEITFITTKVVSIVVVIELVCVKCFVESFSLNGFVCRLLGFMGDSVSGLRERV